MSDSTNRHSLQAFGMAVIIEAAIVIVAGAIIIGNAVTKPALSEPVPITLAEEAQPEKPAEPKPLPPPPIPQPKQKLVAKLEEAKPQLPPQPVAPPVADAPSPIAATPNAFTEPAPAPVPPPPPPTVGKPDLKAAFDAKVRAAVYQWHTGNYPPAALTMHFGGKAIVEFHLRDGVVSGSRILSSCGVGMFDQAALRAVQNASYPETPTELRGHDNLYQVGVEFLK
ncbi:MAG TPA: TonB family protein [Burkholderiaceae bacterium]|jgi:protein TonB